jgi:hypothetical protein
MANHYVRIPEKAWKIIKGSEVMYLTDMWFTELLVEKYVDLVQAAPTEKFYDFIAESMNAVLAGKTISEEIEPVIMNLIDDRMNKRKMALRTGDYIVLQRYFTGHTMQK